MSRDDVIEKAAQRLRSLGLTTPDEQESIVRALADAGLFVDELTPEPLPVGQPRLDPDGCVWQKQPDGEWSATVWANTRKDHDVRSWPVLVPETDLDDHRAIRDALRAKRDRLAARVADLEESRLALLDKCCDYEARVADLERPGAQAVDADALVDEICPGLENQGWHFDGDAKQELADAIREHLPAAARPVAVEPWDLAEWIVDHVGDDDFTGDLNVSAIQGAILTYARRDAEAGER